MIHSSSILHVLTDIHRYTILTLSQHKHTRSKPLQCTCVHVEHCPRSTGDFKKRNAREAPVLRDPGKRSYEVAGAIDESWLNHTKEVMIDVVGIVEFKLSREFALFCGFI
jgi:hypothetical protein